MKKIGMFLGFQSEDNLSIHGIGRLLAFILKESDKEKKEIVLFCPEWLSESLNKLLSDNKIKANDFEIVTTSKIPFGVKVKKIIWNRKKMKKKRKISKLKILLSSIKKKTGNLLEKITADFFSTSSFILLAIKITSYLLLSLLALPIITLLAVGFIIIVASKKIMNKMKNSISLINLGKKMKSGSFKIRGIIYQLVIDKELNKLVTLVNERNDVNVCYIPSMAWPQITNLKCKKVLAAPDIVFYDFPTQFLGVTAIHKRIRNSIAAADHLITYSQHVKDEHLVRKSGVNPNKVSVIKHANIKMNEHLKLSPSIQKSISINENSKQIINKYILQNYNPGHFLYDCDIEDIDYVIYSSQYRPHKNISNLLKAIKIINIDMHRNIKLIVTGNINEVDYLKKYIKDNYLDNDIIIMHNINSELLAALNQMAKVSVNPTLFEGGFPFTFSEAYSVGTPSVMSDIPMVNTEIDKDELLDMMLFDPYIPHSIAEKIIWAVDNSKQLYEAQAQLYEKFDQRDWKKVVGEYNQIFRKFMN